MHNIEKVNEVAATLNDKTFSGSASEEIAKHGGKLFFEDKGLGLKVYAFGEGDEQALLIEQKLGPFCNFENAHQWAKNVISAHIQQMGCNADVPVQYARRTMH